MIISIIYCIGFLFTFILLFICFDYRFLSKEELEKEHEGDTFVEVAKYLGIFTESILAFLVASIWFISIWFLIYHIFKDEDSKYRTRHLKMKEIIKLAKELGFESNVSQYIRKIDTSKFYISDTVFDLWITEFSSFMYQKYKISIGILPVEESLYNAEATGLTSVIWQFTIRNWNNPVDVRNMHRSFITVYSDHWSKSDAIYCAMHTIKDHFFMEEDGKLKLFLINKNKN